MAAIVTSYRITGLSKVLSRLDGMSGKTLARKTKTSLSKSGRAILAPAIAEATPHKYGGHAGPYPTKGLLGKRQKITARGVKLRSGEIAAVSVKPRVWFEHFVVRGTKPHFIGPKNASSLYFGGHFTGGVQHPGAVPNDYIHGAAQGHEQEVVDALAKDLFDLLGI